MKESFQIQIVHPLDLHFERSLARRPYFQLTLVSSRYGCVNDFKPRHLPDDVLVRDHHQARRLIRLDGFLELLSYPDQIGAIVHTYKRRVASC